MLSGGLFKNRGNRSNVYKEEVLDPTVSDDDDAASFTEHDRQEGIYDFSLRPAGRTIDPGWSFRADKTISKTGNPRTLQEISDDEDDDLYTSDLEAEEGDENKAESEMTQRIPQPPLEAPPKTPKSAKSAKKKKVKKIDAAVPLESSGKLKKKKKRAGDASTVASSSDSVKSKKKGKAGKTKNKSQGTSRSLPEVPVLDASTRETPPAQDGTSPKTKSKKKTKKQTNAAASIIPVTKMSIRSNFFKENKLYMSLMNLNSNPPKNDDPKDPSSSTKNSESDSSKSTTVDPQGQVDAKKLKANAVSKIRAFTTVREHIKEQQQFLAAFDDEPQKDDSHHPQSPHNFDNLINELQNYETMLETERSNLSKQEMAFRLKQESVEQLLNEEAQKNEALELRLQQLEEQLANTCDIKQVNSLKSKNKCLETQVELLQQKSDRQQETIESMMVKAEKSELKRKGSLNSYLVSPSSVTRKRTVSPPNDLSMRGGPVYEEDEEEEAEEPSGYTSISAMPGKAQGELLQLRSTLNQQNTIIEEQAKELQQLKLQMVDLSQQKGVQNLRKHVENLEREKEYFVAEIERLKKNSGEEDGGNSATTSTNTTVLPVPPPPLEAPASIPMTPRTAARWFTMTGKVETMSDKKGGVDSEKRDAVDDFFQSKADLSFDY